MIEKAGNTPPDVAIFSGDEYCISYNIYHVLLSILRLSFEQWKVLCREMNPYTLKLYAWLLSRERS